MKLLLIVVIATVVCYALAKYNYISPFIPSCEDECEPDCLCGMYFLGTEGRSVCLKEKGKLNGNVSSTIEPSTCLNMSLTFGVLNYRSAIEEKCPEESVCLIKEMENKTTCFWVFDKNTIIDEISESKVKLQCIDNSAVVCKDGRKTFVAVYYDPYGKQMDYCLAQFRSKSLSYPYYAY